jgi:hypothetical protein
MKYAQIDSDGKATGFYDRITHIQIPTDAIEITDEQWADWWPNVAFRRWQNGELVSYDPPQPPIDLTAYAADVRWRKEVGGITVADVHVATDDRSKQMIIGARIAAGADPEWSTKWVGADGSINDIDATTIVAISDAVQVHVNACFTIYASVKSDIDTGAITTTQEIDAAFA